MQETNHCQEECQLKKKNSSSAKAMVQVPPKYQTKYEELMCSNVFSKNDQDIRKVEHNILFIDSKPRFQKQYLIPDAYRPSVEA
jgi:hypothetical protein